MNNTGLDLIEAQDLESVYMANVYDIVAPEWRSQFIEFNDMICQGGSGTLVFEIIGLKGTRRWMETYAHSFDLQDGTIGHLAITNDISDRIERNRKIQKQQEALLEAGRLTALGEFAGGIAHEINNPLAIIKAKAALINHHLKSGEIDETYLAKSVSDIEETVGRISGIIKTLKTLSRDSTDDDFEVSDLVQIIEDALSLCQERCKLSNIQVRKILPEALPAKCQKVAIGQMIMNLLNNSHDAIAHQKNPWVAIELVKLKNKVKLIFTDSGNGIAEEHQASLLNPFFTTKAPGDGTGLGLSFCASVVKKHKGQLYLNTKSKNTQFVVEIALL